MGAMPEGMEDGEFVICRELSTGKGPCNSASAYCADLLRHVLNIRVQDTSLQHLHSNPSPFRLTNRGY
jgi:hypothetical protein